MVYMFFLLGKDKRGGEGGGKELFKTSNVSENSPAAEQN